MNETDAEIEIKRVNSAPDMFYRVPVETSQPESVLPCFPSLTLETLKTVLKINLMTLCTLTTFLCNPITNFYVFVIDGCMSDLETYLKVSKVIFTVSIFIFPFISKWKLHAYHKIRNQRNS